MRSVFLRYGSTRHVTISTDDVCRPERARDLVECGPMMSEIPPLGPFIEIIGFERNMG